jgi:hypothetical protein
VLQTISSSIAYANPSNNDVIRAIKDQSPLAIAGCLDIKNFQRKNGFNRGEQYIVEYAVTVYSKKSLEQCIETLKKPLKKDQIWR